MVDKGMMGKMDVRKVWIDGVMVHTSLWLLRFVMWIVSPLLKQATPSINMNIISAAINHSLFNIVIASTYNQWEE